MTDGAQLCPRGITLLEGDSREVLKGLADNSVDAIVTDPPYGLSGRAPCAQVLSAWLMGREFGEDRTGFMGKAWDGFVPGPSVWRECLRVLKPGGYLLAFFGTRTEDLGSIAIRLAGFERRDMIAWLYGSGFPKSLDISQAIDRHNGDARPVIGRETLSNDIRSSALLDVAHGVDRPGFDRDVTSAASAASAAWKGWGTMLKPALEPIVFAQKPLAERTYAANVLAHGTGALNIDGCRLGVDATDSIHAKNPNTVNHGRNDIYGAFRQDGSCPAYDPSKGRFPANVVHDGSPEVVDRFPTSDIGGGPRPSRQSEGSMWGIGGDRLPIPGGPQYGDSRSVARFFYSAKADGDDRFGTIHSTVKPIDLMAWLCRLVTPPGGVVLDPFAGSGTTGAAALGEGLRAILIERDPAHMADIRSRFEHLAGGGGHSAQVKRRHKAPVPLGGMFGDEL